MVKESARPEPQLRLVAFLLDAQRCGLPLPVVERVLPMAAVSPLPGAPDVALGVINLHGRVLPVLDLRRRLGLVPRTYGTAAHLVLARTSRRSVILPVDEALGVQEVAADAVTGREALLPGRGYVTGIVALPDGLLFIHDLETVLSLDEEERLARALGDLGP
ncbi:MAG TPA: chemotaxis protein CheW [Methylomirabilota bacterium]|jgi:purine-binding chemotaxis protein CheW|nr:chemotaxis protein CheW [Methylomirabilota bacterium]